MFKMKEMPIDHHALVVMVSNLLLFVPFIIK